MNSIADAIITMPVIFNNTLYLRPTNIKVILSYSDTIELVGTEVKCTLF